MKIIRNGQGYELVEITKDEQERIREELRQTNIQLMQQCIKDADEIAARFFGEYSNDAVGLIAAQLFDKLATKQFSEEQRVLTKKVHWMKEEYRAMDAAAQGQYDPDA